MITIGWSWKFWKRTFLVNAEIQSIAPESQDQNFENQAMEAIGDDYRHWLWHCMKSSLSWKFKVQIIGSNVLILKEKLYEVTPKNRCVRARAMFAILGEDLFLGWDFPNIQFSLKYTFKSPDENIRYLANQASPESFESARIYRWERSQDAMV